MVIILWCMFLQEDFVGVAKQLLALWKKKFFLQEFCASATCQLLDVSQVGMCKNHIIHHLELDGGWEDCTSEQLQVLLHLSKLHSKV